MRQLEYWNISSTEGDTGSGKWDPIQHHGKRISQLEDEANTWMTPMYHNPDWNKTLENYRMSILNFK